MLAELIQEIKKEIADKCLCDQCDGDKVVQNIEWKEWFEKRHNDEFDYFISKETSNMYAVWLKDNPMPNGPEEIDCHKCGGTGVCLSQSQLLLQLQMILSVFTKQK